jgi:hypothetical protein
MSYDGDRQARIWGLEREAIWSEWEVVSPSPFAVKRIARNVSQPGIGADDSATTGL